MIPRMRWEDTPAEQARIADNLAALAEQTRASNRADFAPGDRVRVRITGKSTSDGTHRPGVVLRLERSPWCMLVHVEYADGSRTKVDAARVTRDRGAAKRRKGAA